MKQKPLIIMPLHFSWDWHNPGETGMARELAKKHQVILSWNYLWIGFNDWLTKRERVFHEIEPNIFIFRPISIVPFNRWALAQRLSDCLLPYLILVQLPVAIVLSKLFHWKRIIVWNHPFTRPLPFYLPGAKITRIYETFDYWTYLKPEYERYEKALLKQVDKVFVNAQVLWQMLKHKHQDVRVVPYGFNVDLFDNNLKTRRKKRTNKMPIIGYVGGVNNRLDLTLLESLMKVRREWKFVFYGPIQGGLGLTEEEMVRIVNTWRRLPNVEYGGTLPHKDIPGVIQSFDVGMIPYDLSMPLNYFSLPTKFFEYAYVGKPIISTPMVELIRYMDMVKLGENTDAWEKAISQLLAQPWPKEVIERQRNMVLANSWTQKYRSIIKALNEN
jgi:hypothetical protein